MPDAIADFKPVNVPLTDYPHPVGAVVRGSVGVLHVVTDRGGFAYLACCTSHEAAGRASGWHVQANAGRILGEHERVDGARLDDCGRDVVYVPLTEDDVDTALDCGCVVERGNVACERHDGDPARTDCGDCQFGVPVVYHECA